MPGSLHGTVQNCVKIKDCKCSNFSFVSVPVLRVVRAVTLVFNKYSTLVLATFRGSLLLQQFIINRQAVGFQRVSPAAAGPSLLSSKYSSRRKFARN